MTLPLWSWSAVKKPKMVRPAGTSMALPRAVLAKPLTLPVSVWNLVSVTAWMADH